ncbi:hypothetical protein Taro_027126 [Colocasia esculenta]|uniref:Uncharacterized protein n=1 Tax=Colocasia esculenta TaxID=4460 RepID=A0A843VLL3_COLES|nr:hypothetical protein [Colocasia esculenta]
MVAVALNGRGVDANLCNLQVIGSPESRFSTWFFLSLALASRPRIPKASNSHRSVIGGSWNVWRCRIGRGNAVAWCNLRRSSRRTRREPGIFSFNGCKPCKIDLGFLQEQWLKILASISTVAKLISRDIDGHIPCRLLPVGGSRCCRQHSADGEYFYSFYILLSCSINCWYYLLLLYLWFLVCSVLGEFPTEPVTSEAHPYPPTEISGMADRRDWGGGGDDPEESTQRMIERIWESLTDIRARMDQQAPVPPVVVPPGDGETVPVAPVPPRVEVSRMMTLHSPTGMDWSDERLGVIAMECP